MDAHLGMERCGLCVCRGRHLWGSGGLGELSGKRESWSEECGMKQGCGG